MPVFARNPKVAGASPANANSENAGITRLKNAVFTRRNFISIVGLGLAAASLGISATIKPFESNALATLQEKTPKQVFELKGTTLVAKEIREDGREAVMGNTPLPEDKLRALTGKSGASGSEIESDDLKGSQVIKNITVLFFEFGIMAIKETTMDILIEHAVSSKKLDSEKLKVEENGSVLYDGKAIWKIATSGQLRITPVGA